METDPRTIIITVDDDLDYPSTLIEHLYQAALQRPDAAIGLKGYWFPPTNTTMKDRCDPRTWDHVLQERDYGYYSHENLLYTDAASTDRDVEVHVLGGLLVWLIEAASSTCDGWWILGIGPAGACLLMMTGSRPCSIQRVSRASC